MALIQEIVTYSDDGWRDSDENVLDISMGWIWFEVSYKLNRNVKVGVDEMWAAVLVNLLSRH